MLLVLLVGQGWLADTASALTIPRAKGPDTLLNRAKEAAINSDYDLAFKHLDEAIRLNPQDDKAYYLRGRFRDYKREYDKAIADLTQAIVINPGYASAWCGRGNAREHKGDYAGAVSDFEMAIKLSPHYWYAIECVVWILSTCPDDKIRDGAKALRYAQMENAIPGRRNDWANVVWAAACAETGDFAKAIELEEGYLARWRSDPISVTDSEARLAFYREHKPFRMKMPVVMVK